MDESKSNKNRFLKSVIVLFVFAFITYSFLPPKGFPKDSTFKIEPGTPLGVISYKLKEQKYIKSRLLFEGLLVLKQGEKGVIEGEYFFSKPVNLISLMLRLSGSDFGFERIKITIPEGFNRKEIAARCEKLLDNCSAESFLNKTQDLEGFLFPDTYLVFPGRNEDDLIEKMTQNFDVRTNDLLLGLDDARKKEIIIMASILERESSGDKDISIISGILWKRLEIGMPLQVDAPFYFLLGKTSSQLTTADLKIKSSFNTYINKGLPPEPIGNPGLRAIKAALNPQKTQYLYYLHDSKGNAYYAKTHDEHVRNKKLYLK